MKQEQAKQAPARPALEAKAVVLCALGVLAAALFPVVFLWGSNAGIATFAEAAPPMLAYAGGGLAVYFVLLAASRRPAHSALGAILGVVLFSNYIYIERGLRFVFRRLLYWHVAAIVLALGVVLGILLFVKLRAGAAGTLLRLLSIVFAALLAVNLVRLVPVLLAGGGKAAAETAEAAPAEGGRKRNFYYFIFDEYGNSPFMEKYYDYDNSPLTTGLEERGFSVSYDSYNECASTMVITCNILNLDYVADLATYRGGAEARDTIQQKREDNEVFRLFRSMGYELVGLSHPEYYGLEPVTDTIMDAGVTADGQTFRDLLIANTPLYPFNTVATDETADNVRETFDYLMTPEHFAAGGRFTITHMMLPHPPFVFDKDGGLVSANNYNNWDDKQFYLGQHQYTSKMMLELADHIIENDPDAVVMFTSDHAARASTREGDSEDPMFPLEDRNRSFQAVYIGGEAPPDIEGLSGINVLATVLNTVYDTEYPEVPYRVDPDYL